MLTRVNIVIAFAGAVAACVIFAGLTGRFVPTDLRFSALLGLAGVCTNPDATAPLTPPSYN
jgi:hypothetical protein